MRIYKIIYRECRNNKYFKYKFNKYMYGGKNREIHVNLIICYNEPFVYAAYIAASIVG